MKFKVWIELEHISGPERDAETMLDVFAATIGRQNTAKRPLVLEYGEWDDDAGDVVPSVYEVKLVDDRDAS